MIDSDEVQHCIKGNADVNSDVFSKGKSIKICEMLLIDIYFTRILRCLICSLRTGTVYIKKMVLRARSQAGTQGDLTSAPGFAAVFFLCARIFVLVIQTFIHKDTFYVSDSQSCATIIIIKILEITF